MGIEWLIGVTIAAVSLIGGIIVRDRQVMKAIADGDAELHHRINQVRDTHVRKDDLNGHIKHIETAVDRMCDEQRETNRRIDGVLMALGKPNEK